MLLSVLVLCLQRVELTRQESLEVDIEDNVVVGRREQLGRCVWVYEAGRHIEAAPMLGASSGGGLQEIHFTLYTCRNYVHILCLI